MALRGLLLGVLVLGVAAENTRLKEVFSWKTVEFAFPKSSERADAIKSKTFIPENNLPLGLDVWRDKLFVTVPRWKSGVVSSLNYIDIAGIDTSLDIETDEEPTSLIEIDPDGEEGDEENNNEIEEAEEENDEENDDNGILDGVGDLVAGEDGVLDTVGDLTSPLIGGDSNESGALDGALDAVGDLTAPVTDLVGQVGDILPDEPLGAVGDLAAPVTDLVGDVTDALPGPVGDLVGGLTDPVNGLLGNDDKDEGEKDQGDNDEGENDQGDDDDGNNEQDDDDEEAEDDTADDADAPLDAVGDLAAPVTDLVGDVTDALPGPVGDLVGGLTDPVDSLLGNDDNNGGASDDQGDENTEATDENADAPVTDLLGDVTDTLPDPVQDIVGGLTDPVDDLLGNNDNNGGDTDDQGDTGGEDIPENVNVDGIKEPTAIGLDGNEIPVAEDASLEGSDYTDSSESRTDEDETDELRKLLRSSIGNPPYRSLGSKKYARVEGHSKKCSENDQNCRNIKQRKSKSKKSKKAERLKSPKTQENKEEKNVKANTNKTEKKSKTSKASQKKAKKSNGNKNESFQGNVSEKPQKNSKGKQATSSKTKKTSKKKTDSAKNKNSNKVKHSQNKGNNTGKGVSKKKESQDLMCRDYADNPCGIPMPDPLFGEPMLRPPKKVKDAKYDEAKKNKKQKKKKRKDCKKKCRKPKKECVKPAKVSSSSPALVPYPNIETNTPAKDSKDTKITSVFRVRVDACDRLWAMDTGIADILGNTVVYSSPQILIYDLLTDKLVRKYEFKSEENQESSFFANIVVDAAKDKCDDAFAYVPDLGSYAIVVYDFKNDKAWRIKHNYFHFNPLQGNYNVGGVNFQWTDGIFSLALTRPHPDGSKTAYFHALSSYSQFKVNTLVLQNNNEAKSSNYSAYSLVGNKGPDSQTSANFIHEPTGVMFYTQVNKNAIYCWNTDKPFKKENLEEIASDPKTMIFPNDLKVDYKNNLWVLTDKLPVFVKTGLDDSEVNYRIFVAPVSQAIKNTKCAP